MRVEKLGKIRDFSAFSCNATLHLKVANDGDCHFECEQARSMDIWCLRTNNQVATMNRVLARRALAQEQPGPDHEYGNGTVDEVEPV